MVYSSGLVEATASNITTHSYGDSVANNTTFKAFSSHSQILDFSLSDAAVSFEFDEVFIHPVFKPFSSAP
jgi:hypothetical protein